MTLPEKTTGWEIWRASRVDKTIDDVLVYSGSRSTRALEVLANCEQDRIEKYPDAQVEFYLVRVTVVRQRVEDVSLD